MVTIEVLDNWLAWNLRVVKAARACLLVLLLNHALDGALVFIFAVFSIVNTVVYGF